MGDGAMDWAALVTELRRRNARLEEENAALRQEVLELRATVAQLQKRIRELEARANQNSRNSSRPPSSDLPSAPPPPGRRRSGRRPGGQPGHPGHRCAPVPREQVDHFVDCWPTECRHCHESLSAAGVEDGPAVPYQVQDVHIVREVTQYDQHRVVCPHCGHRTMGSLPAEVAHSQYGPGLTALVAMGSGIFQLARREVSRFCREVAGVALSVGSVQKLCEEVAAGLAAPVQELTEAIRQQAAVGMDETGWRDKFKRRYLWRVGCALGSVFKIGTRAAEVGKGLLGATFAGCAMTDRYGGHNWIPAKRRQYCWSHLDRDGQGLIDLGRAAADYGRAVRAAAKAIFQLWRDFQQAGGGPEARLVLRAALEPVQRKLKPVLERGQRSRTKKVVNLCEAMFLNWDSLWLFASQEGIEPTNNGSEREVRRAVLWRRRSLGTHSDAGAAFVERMLTVSSTCRGQRRSPLTYLTEVAHALRAGQPGPSLLPPADPGLPAADDARSQPSALDAPEWAVSSPPEAARPPDSPPAPVFGVAAPTGAARPAATAAPAATTCPGPALTVRDHPGSASPPTGRRLRIPLGAPP